MSESIEMLIYIIKMKVHKITVENYSLVFHIIMWMSIVLGFYVRLKGIGTWPLALDEYYIAKSVENILSNGLPAFQYGGYYTRGILYQYLLAPILFFNIPAESALRIVSSVFNLLTIPAIYFIAKRISGGTVACVVVIVFSISLWEIEFSRFGRMYVPFQAVFIWYLYFLHRVIAEGSNYPKIGMYLLSILSLFVWEGGILLMPLNFLHLFLRKNNTVNKDVLISIMLLLVSFAYISIDFRVMNAGVQLPSSLHMMVSGKGVSGGPIILWESLSLGTPWMIAAGLILFGSIWVVFKLLINDDYKIIMRIGLSVAIILSIFNLFSVAIILIFMLLLFRWVDFKELLSRNTVIVWLTITANVMFWVIYCLYTDAWHSYFPVFEPEMAVKKILVVLFKYPDIWSRVLYPWYSVMPVLSLILGSLFSAGVLLGIAVKNDKIYRELRHLSIIIIYFICCIGIISTSYISTRYTFFLYPLIILFSTIILHKVVSSYIRNAHLMALLSGLMIAAIIWVSEDFDLNHMLHVDSMEINYRMSYDEGLAVHYYTRADYKTPAEYINHNIKSGDIVITTELTPEYYLDQLDYVYRSYKHGEFSAVSTAGGRRERWTGAKLIYRDVDLYQLINETKSAVWLIASKSGRKWHKDQAAIYHNFYDKIIYTGVDGIIEVYRIEKKNIM